MKIFYFFFALNTIISIPLKGQWVRAAGPLNGIFSLAASGTNIFAGNNTGKIYRSTDNGTNWTTVYNGSGRTDAITISDTNIFAANDAGIFLSTNNGENWASSGLANVVPQALAVYNDGTDINLFAGTYQSGIFKSTDNGTSWSAVNSGLTGNSLKITALFVSDTNLFSGTWGSSAFRSTNKGETWDSVHNGLTSNNIHAFTVSSGEAGGTNLFAGTYFANGVYLSTDNGDSWEVVNAGLTSTKIRALVSRDTNLFAGTDSGGVFLSTNNGSSWTAFNDGLTNFVVNALMISGTDIFAGTNNGVWRRPLSDIVTDAADQIGIPSHFVLEQNYPNPFNPFTTIRYLIPVSGFVTIKVYDVLGSEIAVLVNEEKTAGSYEFNFDASQLSSGIYFYSIRAGNFADTKKMTLIR